MSIIDDTAPPAGWEREVPKFRVTRPVRPSPNNRHRHEPPFSTIFENDVWQFAEREYAAREEIETKEWPHPSFRPLNYSAQKVLAFFNSAMKSRLTRSPWHNDAVRLDNGLSDAPAIFDVRPPQIKPMNLRPVA